MTDGIIYVRIPSDEDNDNPFAIKRAKISQRLKKDEKSFLYRVLSSSDISCTLIYGGLPITISNPLQPKGR